MLRLWCSMGSKLTTDRITLNPTTPPTAARGSPATASSLAHRSLRIHCSLNEFLLHQTVWCTCHSSFPPPATNFNFLSVALKQHIITTNYWSLRDYQLTNPICTLLSSVTDCRLERIRGTCLRNLPVYRLVGPALSPSPLLNSSGLQWHLTASVFRDLLCKTKSTESNSPRPKEFCKPEKKPSLLHLWMYSIWLRLYFSVPFLQIVSQASSLAEAFSETACFREKMPLSFPQSTF